MRFSGDYPDVPVLDASGNQGMLHIAGEVSLDIGKEGCLVVVIRNCRKQKDNYQSLPYWFLAQPG